MKISPIDITHKTFSKKLMGLDPEEVMHFLQMVASQMEATIHERNSLKEALREKDLSLLEYKDRDKILKDTIATATQMSERLRQDADREAKLIVADAQQKAEMITRDSRDSLKKMYHEVTEPYAFLWRLQPALRAGGQVIVVDVDRPTAQHGIPPEQLFCEFQALGFRLVEFVRKPELKGYYAQFEVAGPRPEPAAIKPCAATKGKLGAK